MDTSHRVNKQLGWHNKLTRATPLWEPDLLGQLSKCPGFDKWDLIGILTVGDMWIKGRLATFADLQHKLNTNSHNPKHYLQISHAIKAVLPRDVPLPEASPLADRLILDPMNKKAISLTYKMLLNNRPDPLLRLRQYWETDLGELEDKDWRDALASPREVAIPMRLRLVQLKILLRIYLDAGILVKIGRRADPLCLRKCCQIGTFFHIIWDCSLVQLYWGDVTKQMERAGGKTLKASPQLCLLNIWEATDLTQT